MDIDNNHKLLDGSGKAFRYVGKFTPGLFRTGEPEYLIIHYTNGLVLLSESQHSLDEIGAVLTPSCEPVEARRANDDMLVPSVLQHELSS